MKEDKTNTMFWIKSQTKSKGDQAFVRYVFIDQYVLIVLNATTENFHKITVLKFGNQNNFIFQLVQSLFRVF